jgi:protein phosphatase
MSVFPNLGTVNRSGKSSLRHGSYAVGDAVGRVSGVLATDPVAVGELVVECAGATETGPRSSNDDAFLMARVSVPREAQVLLVADGMGGLPCAEVASCVVTQVMYRQLEKASLEVDPERGDLLEHVSDFARSAFGASEDALMQLGSDRGLAKTPGSTLTAAVICGGTLVWMHAGDSRCYLLRGGQLWLLTSDHNVFSLIRQAGVERVNPALKSYLTNCIGADTGPVKVDVGMEPLKSGDWVLVCSDGLTNTLTDAEITSSATADVRPAALARTLVQSAVAKGARDNVTVAVAHVL